MCLVSPVESIIDDWCGPGALSRMPADIFRDDRDRYQQFFARLDATTNGALAARFCSQSFYFRQLTVLLQAAAVQDQVRAVLSNGFPLTPHG